MEKRQKILLFRPSVPCSPVLRSGIGKLLFEFYYGYMKRDVLVSKTFHWHHHRSSTLSQKNKSMSICEQSMSNSLFDSQFSLPPLTREAPNLKSDPPSQFPGELPLLLLLSPPQHQVTSSGVRPSRNVLLLQHFPDDQSIRLRSNLETAASKFTKFIPYRKFFW